MESASQKIGKQEGAKGEGRYFATLERKNELRQSFSKLQDAYAKEEPEMFAWIQAFLKKFPFQELRAIQEEASLRSGVTREDIISPNIDDIYVFKSREQPKKTLMYYQGGARAVVFNTLNGIYHFARVGDTTCGVAIIIAMVHEFTHAMSDGRWWGEGSALKLKTGYRVGTIDLFKKKEDLVYSYYWFDEGVTEYCARTFGAELLRRSPIEMPDGSLITHAQYEEYGGDSRIVHDTYGIAYHFIKKLSHHLAENLDVPDDVVMQGIIAGQRDGTFSSKEFSSLLDETVGKGFRRQLAVVKEGRDFERLIESHLFPEMPQSTLSRWVSIFKKYIQ